MSADSICRNCGSKSQHVRKEERIARELDEAARQERVRTGTLTEADLHSAFEAGFDAVQRDKATGGFKKHREMSEDIWMEHIRSWAKAAGHQLQF